MWSRFSDLVALVALVTGRMWSRFSDLESCDFFVPFGPDPDYDFEISGLLFFKSNPDSSL